MAGSPVGAMGALVPVWPEVAAVDWVLLAGVVAGDVAAAGVAASTEVGAGALVTGGGSPAAGDVASSRVCSDPVDIAASGTSGALVMVGSGTWGCVCGDAAAFVAGTSAAPTFAAVADDDALPDLDL